jgi:predicted acyl esterase
MSQPTSAEIIAMVMEQGDFTPGPPTASIGKSDPFFSHDRTPEYGVHVETIEVPTRDGSHLVSDLRRPAGPDGLPATGRFPGIVYDFNAYDARQFYGLGADYFVMRGYVAVVSSVRGTGGTPGRLDPFGRQEQQDSYDLIEWLAAQPFSTGKVGQTGVSYGGHNTLLAAVNQPPHLTAIIPVQAISDWYENTIYRGGIPNAQIHEWQQRTAPETLETYPQHPLYDAFWRDRSVKARWDKLTIPVLDVGGWLDPYRDAMVANFTARQENTWMVAGPWMHGMVPGQFEDIASAAYLAWWDHWLTDLPAPLPKAKVTSYEMPGPGAGHGWQQFSTWPPAGSQPASWIPTADGVLSAATEAATIAEFEANSGRLTFDTAPLAHDIVMTAGAQAVLRVAFTAMDGNVAVVLDDVDESGAATRVTNGWLKASHRNGHEKPAPVTPSAFVTLEVPLWPAHYRMVAGHRLRMTVSSDDFPNIETQAPFGTVYVELGTSATRLEYQALP